MSAIKYLKSNSTIKEFPRFMMCRFFQPDKYSYQQGISHTITTFEIEILKVENYGRRILFKSNNPNVILDRYKDINGNTYLDWNLKTQQYISVGVSYTLPWEKEIFTDNIILLPEKEVSVKSRIKNFLHGKIR